MMGKCTLYRHFSSTGELLYVGISRNAIKRLQNHKHLASWYYDIARIDLEHFETRREALRAESSAIANENPKFISVPKKPPVNKHDHYNGGRPASMTPEREAKAIEMIKAEKPVKEILAELQKMEGPTIGRTKIYSWIKEYRDRIGPDEISDDH